MAQYEKDAARARRLFKELDREGEPRQWELAELLHRMKDTGATLKTIGGDVGRNPTTVKKYVAIWQEHGAVAGQQRPRFIDAYAVAGLSPAGRAAVEAVADDRGITTQDAQRSHREEVRQVREALKDPALAREVLSPAEIVKVVRGNTDAVRALARHQDTREAIEEAAIEARASEPIGRSGGGGYGGGGGGGGYRETARDSASERERSFGSDLALTELRNAATALGEAIVAKEKYGVENTAEEREIVARLRRYLDAYDSKGALSDDDQSWLADHGIVA